MLGRSTRSAAYRDFRRAYNTWSAARPGPYQKVIRNAEDGRRAVREYFALLRETKFLDKPDDSFRLLLFPEFAFNVFEDISNPAERFSHGAHSPLNTETVEAIRDGFRAEAAKLPPGFLIAVGGIAHDTGEHAPDGKIMGMNVGFLIESGADRPYVIMSKYHHSVIDQWPDTFTPVPGSGPVDLEIADPRGGRPARLSFVICLDAAKGPFTRLMARADIIAISGYGIPAEWEREWLHNRRISEHAEVAANDSAPVGAITGKSGILAQAQVPRHPWLKGLHSLTGQNWLGDALLWAYDTFLGLRPDEALASDPGFVRLGTSRATKGGLYVTVSDERPLPPETVFDTERPAGSKDTDEG
ncbi:hypothetical protein [Nonomuraea lactucae]|uniref:hypothetical protein n=1 Tax=Nonomuraea lactucae TaxID=2249762 RepID=UPI000DE56134|nr:hypothetical protein [Nonomuraea lactucae]